MPELRRMNTPRTKRHPRTNLEVGRCSVCQLMQQGCHLLCCCIQACNNEAHGSVEVRLQHARMWLEPPRQVRKDSVQRR